MRPTPPRNTTAAEPWRGVLRLGLGWGQFTGAAGDNSPHAHHALQLVVSEAPLQLWVRGAALAPSCGTLLAADVAHRLAPSAVPVSLLYVEPDSHRGRQLSALLCDGWRHFDSALSQALRAACAAPEPAEAVLACLLPARETRAPPRSDALMEALMARLPRALPSNPRLAELAQATGLSTSRLQHRFRAHTGMALRPYWRWRRLLTAVAAVREGAALTDAALAAGFADAAHFTRTLRRHFGVTPRVLLALHEARG